MVTEVVSIWGSLPWRPVGHLGGELSSPEPAYLAISSCS